MKTKNLLLLTLVIVALAFLITYLQKNRLGSAQDPKLHQPIQSGFYGESFDSLHITNKGKTLHIKKEDQIWEIVEKNGYPVDLTKLANVIEKINRVQLASKVTDEAAKLGSLQLLRPEKGKALNEETGTLLEFFKNGKNVFELLIGKNRSVTPQNTTSPHALSGGTYIRVQNEKTAYLVKENFSWDSDPKAWMLKSIIAIDSNQIKGIEVKNAGSLVKIERKNPQDKFVLMNAKENEQLNENAAKVLSNAFSSLSVVKAESITATSVKTNFSDKKKIVLEFFDNRMLVLWLQKGLTDDDNYLLRVEPLSKNNEKIWSDNNPVFHYLSQKWIFKIAKVTAEGWLKKRGDLTKDKS